MMPSCNSFYIKSYLLVLLASLMIDGCTYVGARSMGEGQLNSWIGKSIEGVNLESSPVVKKIHQGNVIRYLDKEKSGCEIEFLVDAKSKEILSWSYISSPDKCFQGDGSF